MIIYKNYLKITKGILLISTILMTGCFIDGEPSVEELIDEQNEQAIQDYLDAKGLVAQQSTTGIYYIVDSNFVGNDLDIFRYVNISFTVKLLDETVFDIVPESNPFELFVDSSGNVIIYSDRSAATGIAIATGFLKLGQTGTFIMDAGTAYGFSTTFTGSEGLTVSANTPLVFEIKALSSKTENELIEEYIANNNLSPVTRLPSRVRYIETTSGTGADSTGRTNFFVKYEGKFLDNEVFDRSLTGDFLFAKGSNQVIAGFEEAVLGMQVGDKATVILPNSEAYGDQGSAPNILPYTPIVFDLELVNVE